MRFTEADVVLLESFNDSLDLSCSDIDLVGGDGLGIIVIFSDDGSSRLLKNNKALIYKLNFLGLLFLKDDISVVFTVLFSDDEHLLDTLTLFDLDVFNLSLSESWLNLVKVFENFFSLNVLGNRIFGDDSHFRFFGYLDILQLITENFFNRLDDNFLFLN